MVGEAVSGDPDWDEARGRWRSAADRLWSAALADAEGYRETVARTGVLLAELRHTVATPDELLAVDAEPERHLGDLVRVGGAPAPLIAAACAVRAEEIDAARARERRRGLLAKARHEGRTWVVLEDGITRSVSMHLPTGLALVTVDDPYRGRDPHGLGELVLAVDTGEPIAGHGGAEEWFGARVDRDAAREQRRAEIATLDDGGAMVSDER